MEEFLKENESKHELIKNDLLNATLTFHHRVKMFRKHIVMSKGNPLAISYHSYKVEFAMRGAGHIHGVLWVDWEHVAGMVKYSIDDVKAGLDNIKEEQDVTPTQKAAIEEFADLFITCSLKDKETRDIVKAVNFHHHTKTRRKYGCPCRFKVSGG